MKYTIQPGDTLSRIALDHYGDAKLCRAIQAVNDHKIPDVDFIVAGDEIYLPDEIQGWPLRHSRLMAAAPDLLEALRAEEEWRSRESAGELDPEWDYEEMVAAKRRSAIAKATGKQS